MRLKNACISLSGVTLRGASGFNKLAVCLWDEWFRDCIRIHGPAVLASVGGIRPLVEVVKANFEIVTGPIEQYPHVIRGLVDGFESGARTTAVELCNISAAVVSAVRVALEIADSAVSPEDNRMSTDALHVQQPADMLHGLASGRDALFTAGKEAYERVWIAPHRTRSHRFVRASILAKTIGATPGAALRPLIGMCEAATLSIQGIRNTIHPESHNESREKYR